MKLHKRSPGESFVLTCFHDFGGALLLGDLAGERYAHVQTGAPVCEGWGEKRRMEEGEI